MENNCQNSEEYPEITLDFKEIGDDYKKGDKFEIIKTQNNAKYLFKWVQASNAK